MKIFQLACLFIVSTFAFPLVADSSAEQELSKHFSDIQTIKADFTQTIYDHEGIELQETRGEFIVSRPQKIYWSSFPPYEQTVISNGLNVWSTTLTLNR